MTYNVFGGTLSLTQSITLGLAIYVSRMYTWTRKQARIANELQLYLHYL